MYVFIFCYCYWGIWYLWLFFGYSGSEDIFNGLYWIVFLFVLFCSICFLFLYFGSEYWNFCYYVMCNWVVEFCRNFLDYRYYFLLGDGYYVMLLDLIVCGWCVFFEWYCWFGIFVESVFGGRMIWRWWLFYW